MSDGKGTIKIFSTHVEMNRVVEMSPELFKHFLYPHGVNRTSSPTKTNARNLLYVRRAELIKFF